MIGRAKLDAIEQKEKIYNRRQVCEVCKNRMPFSQAQLAHRIPATKAYIKQYGAAVIHHQLNLALVDCLKCNAAVLLDPKTHPVEAAELINKIREAKK